MTSVLELIGREQPLFADEERAFARELEAAVRGRSFLVIGGAGSIGQAVVRELFAREPARLHVVDISENNLVELVRDLRSSLGYIGGDFRTLPLDAGSLEFRALIAAAPGYDYILNLSALKHVRSEKDPYSLMRMIEVNVLNTVRTLDDARRMGARKYFAVSTDKATNPVNMMGASKRIMELFLLAREPGAAGLDRALRERRVLRRRAPARLRAAHRQAAAVLGPARRAPLLHHARPSPGSCA